MSSSRGVRRTWRRTAAWLVGGLAIVLVVGIAGVAWFYPSVTAASCPTCYGLVRVQHHLYVEDGLSPARRHSLADTVRSARHRVAVFYGVRRSRPDVLICVTDECYERIGGGQERGIAVLNWAVMLSPRGINQVIATHEMAHVELHHRLDSADSVPQWFDEGLAVVIADDARYLRPETAGDRCRVTPDKPLPETLTEWLSSAKADPDVYAKAACRVSRWVAASGGPRAALDLIDRVNRGERFATALDG